MRDRIKLIVFTKTKSHTGLRLVSKLVTIGEGGREERKGKERGRGGKEERGKGCVMAVGGWTRLSPAAVTGLYRIVGF